MQPLLESARAESSRPSTHLTRIWSGPLQRIVCPREGLAPNSRNSRSCGISCDVCSRLFAMVLNPDPRVRIWSSLLQFIVCSRDRCPPKYGSKLAQRARALRSSAPSIAATGFDVGTPTSEPPRWRLRALHERQTFAMRQLQ